MAEIKQGILGVTRGKIGPVVGYIWRGANYLRSKPRKSSKKATPKQLLQWDKMSLVSTYASKFRDFVNAHCPAVHNGEKWLNGKEQMISRLMKQGITMINGLQHIEIEKTILSIGNLAPAVIRKINILKTGKLKVQWDNSLVNALTLDTDSLTMMLYNEDLDLFIDIPNVGNRGDKYAHFSLPTMWTKGKVYFWSMWKSADGSLHSTSCFHGMIELIGEQEAGNGKQDAGNGEQKTENREQEAGNGEQEAGNGEQEAGNGEQEVGNRKQDAGSGEQEVESGKQEIKEVMPLEQVREIALKQHLEDVDLINKGEGIGEFTEQSVKEGETTPPSNAVKERELKKWTPPGYTRRVNKRILKQLEEGGSSVGGKKDNIVQKPKGIIDGARSILEVQDINQEQTE